MVSLHCTLPCELRSGDLLEPGKPADLWECSLGFSKNSEVFLVGKTTLSIKSCGALFTRVNRHLNGPYLDVLIKFEGGLRCQEEIFMTLSALCSILVDTAEIYHRINLKF